MTVHTNVNQLWREMSIKVLYGEKCQSRWTKTTLNWFKEKNDSPDEWTSKCHGEKCNFRCANPTLLTELQCFMEKNGSLDDGLNSSNCFVEKNTSPEWNFLTYQCFMEKNISPDEWNVVTYQCYMEKYISPDECNILTYQCFMKKFIRPDEWNLLP